jgi:hypothetical protein
MKSAAVFVDRQRHTCLAVDRSKTEVTFLRINVEDGFDLEKWPAAKFVETFNKELPDYPVEKAARLYAQYAQLTGATQQAMQALGQLVTLTQEEIDMATKKKATNQATKSGKGAKPEKKTDKAPVEKKPAAKKPAGKKEAPAAKAPKAEKGETAAGMFRELIREGKLTDDQIFDKVQKKFGLGDDKRGYVKWYRNDLIKKGEKVPEPK